MPPYELEVYGIEAAEGTMRQCGQLVCAECAMAATGCPDDTAVHFILDGDECECCGADLSAAAE